MALEVIPAIALLAGLAQTPQAGVQVPEPLKRGFETRTISRTGYVRYTEISQWPPHALRTTRFEQRFAGSNIHIEELGDPDGILLRQPDGMPLLGIRNACLPQQYVVDRDQGKIFVQMGSYPHIGMHEWNQHTPFVDIRTVGLHWAPAQMKSVDELLQSLSAEPGREYATRKLGDGHIEVVLTMKSKDANSAEAQLKWRIDPDRDYAIIAIEWFHIGPEGKHEFTCNMTADYMPVDDHWWPKWVESRCDATGYYRRIEIEHVELDQPEHPAHLGIDAMGIPPGTPVFAPTIFPERHAVYLGDGKIVDEEEWRRIELLVDRSAYYDWAASLQARGPGIFPAWWDAAAGHYGIDGVEHRPDEWEAYVRRWIIKCSNGEHYKLAEPLTEKQKVAAWGILADCRKRAMPLVQKRAAELADATKAAWESRQAVAALRARHESQSSPGQSDRPGDVKALLADAESKSERLGNRVVELELPDARLIEIFEELKRRLDGLLTAVQRSDANVLPREPVKPPLTRDGRPLPIQSAPPGGSRSASQAAGPPKP